MNFRNISAWSIRNPVTPIVLFMFLTLAGLISFMRMPVALNPDIDFPVVVVVVSQPGASPIEMETQIAQKVEAAARSIQGVDQIDSTVTEGNSVTVVQLAIGTPIDRAVEDMRGQVQQIRGELPDGILEPRVMRFDTTNDNDLANFAAVSTSMSLEQLSWYVDNTVSRTLLSVPGLAAVERTGGVSREIRVDLDPVKLQSFGITASQVNQQLRASNLNAAGGRAEIAGAEQTLRVLGNAQNAYQLGQTRISLGGGRSVKLSDIATVRDLYAEQRDYATHNGQQILSFNFTRAKNESDVSVYDGAVAALRQLEQSDPRVHFVELNNSVHYAKEQYSAAMKAMIEGALLAVLVVFIFLRDWRATVISALAIPLSAIPTFWFMDLMGFTLNQMTLLALSLVAGVLVDDAIVEIENIVRHMRMGKTAYQAAIDAADEIGLAVLATTMSIVAVFLPVGLMPGIAGQFFKNFGFTVVVSVLLSLLVARMITPMIAAYFLSAKGKASHGEGWLMDRYMALLNWTLQHRWVTVLAGFLSLVFTFFLLAMLPQTFQPTTDAERSVVNITMPPGTTLEQTGRVASEVALLLRRQDEVESVTQRVRVGNAYVVARLKEDRDRTSVEFERALAPRLARIPDARVSFRSQFGGRDVEITLGGEDPDQLQRVANELVEQMATIPELTAPRISGNLPTPEIVIRPRLDLAANMGVTTAALSNAIRIATLGEIEQNTAKFSLSDRQIPIRSALDQDARARMATIRNLPVQTATGGSVPLHVVADIGFGSGPSEIKRTNQMRQITIGADLAPGAVSGVARGKINQLPVMKNLPHGVEQLVLGQAKWQQELIQNFILAVLSGVFLVLAVLVLLYRRFLPPFVNMGSLLLAPLGGLLALWVVGWPISLPVYIGLLMLLGIVAKNSILLIDFALEEMYKGVDKFTAIMDAGHKRAQPIVMTTVAMTAGMTPTAISLSGDSAWTAPMGLTVIGGLLLSTLLTLVLVPGWFSLALGIEQRLGPKLRKWFTTGGPHATLPSSPLPAE